MIIAFDLDGTISAHPLACAAMSHALRAAGWKSVVLTGAIHGSIQSNPQWRANQLHDLNWHVGVDFDELLIAVSGSVEGVAEEKGIYLRDNSVQIFLDDTLMYCETVKRLSPGTMTLRVM